MHLSAMLDCTVRRAGDKEALVYGQQRWTYRELAAASQRAAAVLLDAGLRPGDRLAVMTYNTPAFVIAAFAAWRAGAVLVPVNHKMQTREVDQLLRHSGARLALVDEEIGSRATDATAGVRWLVSRPGESPDQHTRDSFEFQVQRTNEWEVDPRPDTDICQILYTSGTSGRAKGCVHTHRGIALTATYTAAAIPLRRDDRFLITMPIWHASPLNNWTLGTILMGGTIVLQREYDPRRMLEIIQRERITAVFGAPIAFLAPLQVVPDFAEYDLSSVRTWIYGGGALDAHTVSRMMTAYGSNDFHQVYGMSEMGPVGSSLSPEEHIDKAGSIGRGGMPGVDVRVVTSTGADAGPGQTGEIWLRSDTRMVGYLDDKEATASAFVGDWYRSGDLGRIDADGFVSVVDRIQDVIIVGGENVASQEVESVLRGHPDILDVAVVGRPHFQWGETVVAVVVPRAGTTPTLDELRSWMTPLTARYKIPRELILCNALPRTASGKVTKHMLRAELTKSTGDRSCWDWG
ncbi:class I adenylate-forming enzyme family protein [Streptomyces sp. NPDC056707]|uniref:class I adenylate-forming enzyme family protein n=1 Tax=Streptomyces sp. NPDC056707 TaxID=3345919 RepID=UPI00369B7EA8